MPSHSAITPVSSSSQHAPAWTTLGDEELLLRLAEGHAGAFDELFARHGAALLSFLSRMVAHRYDPEDLLQETFLRVLTHARSFKPGSPIRPWLYTIARNTAYNALKKVKARGELEVKADLSDWELSAPDLRRSDPGSRMEKEEQRQRLLDALEKLPAPHREIIVLTMFEGFSYEDAANITGDPEGTLRSRVFHGLRKLRETLRHE